MKTIFGCLLAILAAALIAGCGDSGPAPDAKAETARLDKITEMRNYYDRAGGNYDSMSEGDRAAFVQLVGGDEAKAMEAWNLMKNGPAGKPSAQ